MKLGNLREIQESAFDLSVVLEKTMQLLDVDHPTTKERVSMLAEVQNILLL